MNRLLVGLVALLLGWASQVSPADLLARAEPLSREQMAALARVTGELLVGKSFITYGGFGGGTVTIGAGPRVRTVYYGNRLIEWTGAPARTCAGAEMNGGLVVEWEMDRSGWHATARASTEPRILDGMFQFWVLPATSIRDAGLREFEGLVLRGFRYPYEPPTGTRFEASWQSLWFDPRTGLPVRYEIEIEAPDEMNYGYFLAYAPGWQAGPDPTQRRPDCIPSDR